MRIKIIRYVIYVMFAVIVLDLMYIQIVRGKYYAHLSENNMIRVVPLEGWRGKIFDRNGNILADSRKSYDVIVTDQEVKDRESIFDFLSEVLSESKDRLIRKYQQKKTAPFIPVTIAENVTRDQAIIIEENRYRFPGLFIQEGHKRFYPENKNSAHVLGHVSKINRTKIEKFKEYGYSPQSIVGYSGVEEYYDSYLRGEGGGLQIEVNSRGKQVRLLSIKDPSKGQDIVLTIDKDIQETAMNLLADQIGTIIAMDSQNGEILGMISSPSFNPNHFIESKFAGRIKNIFADTNAPLLNRSITGLYPPGSVFKVPVALAGLDSHKIDRRTTFECKGSYHIGNASFGCTHVHGSQNLIESIAHSCNIYYYQLGRALGADQINRYAHLLGVGELTHIDLPFEKKGKVPSRNQGLLSRNRKWYTGDTINFSIGQGDLLVTPMQMVQMMATVQREGVRIQPHLIYSIGGYRVERMSNEQRVRINKNAFQEVKKGLRATVTDYAGTAHALDLRELYVAGKTGTAQSQKDKEHHSWFVGYAKGDKRDITFCVFLEHGGSSLNAVLLAKSFLLNLHKAEKI